jgi:hypothetical protein
MGICTIVVRRSVAPWLVTVLAACEQAAPATFDPDGAAADAAALHAAFETPLMQSLAYAGPGIDRAMGGVEAEVTAAGGSGFSERLLRASSGALRAGYSSGELAPDVAGRTYVFDEESGAYVVSELAGAPPAGARFQLYAIDPATDAPAEPLAPLGYVDVIGDGTSGVRVRVGEDSGIRIDYRVTASGSEAELRIEVSGFTTTGETRADFAFDNQIELTGTSSGMMRLSDVRALPARRVALECASIVLVRAGLPPELQLDLLLQGPNGEVGVAGAYLLGGSGALEVDVNGDRYAEVQVAGGGFVIAAAADAPLPVSSRDLIDRVMTARDSGLEVFDRLVRPVETLLAP